MIYNGHAKEWIGGHYGNSSLKFYGDGVIELEGTSIVGVGVTEGIDAKLFIVSGPICSARYSKLESLPKSKIINPGFNCFEFLSNVEAIM